MPKQPPIRLSLKRLDERAHIVLDNYGVAGESLGLEDEIIDIIRDAYYLGLLDI